MAGMKISLDAAMRARDVSRPSAADEADAELAPSASRPRSARPEQPPYWAEGHAARTDKPGWRDKPARPDPAASRPARSDAAGADGEADVDADRQPRRRGGRATWTAARQRGRRAHRPAGPPDPQFARKADAAEIIRPDDASADPAQRRDPGGRPPELAQRGDPGGRPPELAQRGDPGGRPPELAQGEADPKPGRAGGQRRRRRSRLGRLAGHGQERSGS
jgi:hypothetical protein